MTVEEHRDTALGTALAALPVPDHRPDALDDVARALRATSDPSVPRRSRLRFRLGLGLAAAAAASVGALVLADRGTGPLPGPEPASAATVSRALAAALAGTRTAQFDLREVVTDADGARAIWRYRVALDTRLGHRVESFRDRTIEVYDARRGIVRWVRRAGQDGPAGASVLSGLAPGGPDPTAAIVPLDRSLGAAVRAIAAAGSASVTETTVDGRPAWLIDTPIRADQLGGDASPNELRAVIDRETGFPLLLRLTRDGQPRRELRLSNLRLDRPLPAATLRLRIPAGGEVYRDDAGFRRSSLDRVRATVGYRPLVPMAVPAGFQLTRVAVSRKPTFTGSEGGNPHVGRIVSLLYQRGLERFLVTTRPIGPSRAAWADPLATGEGFVDRPEVVRIASGALAGTRGELLIDPLVTPHIWTIGRQLVITVSGDLTRAQLLEIAGSLERR